MELLSIYDHHGSHSPDGSGSDVVPYFHKITVCGTTFYGLRENADEGTHVFGVV